MKELECLIIGSGPAGYTAAIYAARADMKPVMYTGLQPGGQLTTTTEVDNFPGYANGVTGPELMQDLEKQAKRFDTEVNFGLAEKFEFATEKGQVHKVYINTGVETKEVLAKTIIISTGATAKYLGLESEERLKGGGVSACATCDGFFYKGKDVVVVGGGDTAAEEATYLSKLCNHVYLLVRKDYMKASKAMQHKVETTENITLLYNTQVKEVLGDKVVKGILALNNKTKEESTIEVQGMFVAIGHKPNTDMLDGAIDLDDHGYIVTKNGSLTNIPGVFASGDVQDSIYRQAITAAGSGCKAALDAERYLGSL